MFNITFKNKELNLQVFINIKYLLCDFMLRELSILIFYQTCLLFKFIFNKFCESRIEFILYKSSKLCSVLNSEFLLRQENKY